MTKDTRFAFDRAFSAAHYFLHETLPEEWNGATFQVQDDGSFLVHLASGEIVPWVLPKEWERTMRPVVESAEAEGDA